MKQKKAKPVKVPTWNHHRPTSKVVWLYSLESKNTLSKNYSQQKALVGTAPGPI
jgi:hypothetical protein